jgi:hypothetical protein
LALDAEIAAFVYIYARIPQIAEIHTSFYVTDVPYGAFRPRAGSEDG